MNNNIEIIESILDDNFDLYEYPIDYKIIKNDTHTQKNSIDIFISYRSDCTYNLEIFQKLINRISSGNIPFNQWSVKKNDIRCKEKFIDKIGSEIDILKRIYNLTGFKLVRCHTYSRKLQNGPPECDLRFKTEPTIQKFNEFYKFCENQRKNGI